jgi:hypothetical protein
VVLGDGEHAAGAARAVVERAHRFGAGEGGIVVGEQDVDHQLDDVAGSEVLAGGLVAHLREPPEQFLEEVAHRVVADRSLRQVQLGELRHHLVEQPGLVQTRELVLEAVGLQDLPSPRREPREVGAQVGGDPCPGH